MYPITKEKKKEYNKTYYEKNKVNIIKKTTEYNNQNKLKVNKQKLEYYKINKINDNLRRLKIYYHKKEFLRLSNILLE